MEQKKISEIKEYSVLCSKVYNSALSELVKEGVDEMALEIERLQKGLKAANGIIGNLLIT